MTIKIFPATEVVTARRIIPATEVTGCRAGCPNTRQYDPNQDGETLGCSYAYGKLLPKEGFAEWCPLKDKKTQ